MVDGKSIQSETGTSTSKVERLAFPTTTHLGKLNPIGLLRLQGLARPCCNVGSAGGAKQLSIAIDSGACDNVICPEGVPGHDVLATRAAINGLGFVGNRRADSQLSGFETSNDHP